MYLGIRLDKLLQTTAQLLCTWSISERNVQRSIIRATSDPDDLGLRRGNPLRGFMVAALEGAVDWIREALASLLLRTDGAVTQCRADARDADNSRSASSFRLIHPTTTTLAMLTCQISSMSGCVARCGQFSRSCFATIAVPKAEELVATPYRHGSKEKAEEFFLDGMTQAMHSLAEQAHPAVPVTIYYAFKQSETEDDAGTVIDRLGNIS